MLIPELSRVGSFESECLDALCLVTNIASAQSLPRLFLGLGMTRAGWVSASGSSSDFLQAS